MKKLQLHLLNFFFGALFVSKKKSNNEGTNGTAAEEDLNNENLYKLLGVTKAATAGDIRKAYKKKSLQYHPDKVAQYTASSNNGGDNKTAQEIQDEFVQIKEAYEILSNKDKRDAYDVFGKEFVLNGSNFADGNHNYYDDDERGGGNREGDGGEGDKKNKEWSYWDQLFGGVMMIHPTQIVENLAHASFFDKTKLFLLVLLLFGIIFIGPILICLKVDGLPPPTHVNGEDDDGKTSIGRTDWVLIMIPFWILLTFRLLITLLVNEWINSIKCMCFFSGSVLLALKWDHTLSSCYSMILIPWYVHQFVTIFEAYLIIQSIHQDLSRTVTIAYLEERILQYLHTDETTGEVSILDEEDGENDGGLLGAYNNTERRKYRDLTDDERDVINREYIIINDPLQEDYGDDNDDEEEGQDPKNMSRDDSEVGAEAKLLFSITRSSEFKEAMMIKGEAMRTIISIVLFRVAFFVLLVLKLDEKRDWNWFLVFTPIIVEIGVFILSNCSVIMSDPETPDDNSDGVIIVDESDKQSDKQSDVDAKEKSDKKPTSTPIDAVSETSPDYVVENQSAGDIGGAEKSNKSPLDAEGDLENANEEDGETISQTETFDADEAEALREDMEYRAHACSNCCSYICYSIILILFLVRLNGEGREEGSRGQYSAFWVIFPVFFFSGIILCACCYFIYGTTERSLERKSQANNAAADMSQDHDYVYGEFSADVEPETSDDVNQVPARDEKGAEANNLLEFDDDDDLD